MAVPSYNAVVVRGGRRRVLVPVPFDPDRVWGAKQAHRVTGTVNGMGVRAVIEPLGESFGILLGPAWRRDCGIARGDKVAVVLVPEGPQRDDLAPDLAAAFADEPIAADIAAPGLADVGHLAIVVTSQTDTMASRILRQLDVDLAALRAQLEHDTRP